MVRRDFGSAIGKFVESDGSTALSESALCAFVFPPVRQPVITQIVASFVDQSGSGLCGASRLLVFEGGNVPLGTLAREANATDIAVKYGVKILLDVIGIGGQFELDLGSRPLVAAVGQELNILHLPPYNDESSTLFSATCALSVLGFYKTDGKEIIYKGYELR